MKKSYLEILITGLLIGVFCGLVGKTHYDNTINKRKDIAEIEEKIIDLNHFSGWYEQKGNKYYFVDGNKQTGLIEVDNKKYFLSEEGIMQIGWVNVDNNWYCFNYDGSMITNSTISGCYLNNDGLIDDENNLTNKVYDNITFRTYKNNRFDFSIQYPSSLIPGNTPENGDGLVFTSDDGFSSLRIGGFYNTEFLSIQEYYSNRLNQINVEPSLNIMEDNYYVISWTESNTIYYEYTRMNESIINNFILSYPESEKNYYDKTIPILVSTFNTPNISE